MRPTRSTRPASTRPASLLAATSGLPLAIALALASLPAMAQDTGGSTAASDETTTTELDTVMVVAQRANRASNGATNLDLDI